jgi:hypothetical protein
VAAGGENADGRWSTPQQVDRRRVYVIPPDDLGRSSGSLGERAADGRERSAPHSVSIATPIRRTDRHDDEEDSMDPTMHAVARSVRSVQRAVMSAPTTTITDAADAARRAARTVAASFEGGAGPRLRTAGGVLGA